MLALNSCVFIPVSSSSSVIKFGSVFSPIIIFISSGASLTVQDLLHQDSKIQDLYFNISEMKLSITSLFSVQIMSYLGASEIIYSDVIDSLISEIVKCKSWILAS